MPYLSEAQHQGDAGEMWFEAHLPEKWKAYRPWPDVGVDRVVVVLDESNLNGHEFRVQIKTFRALKIVENEIVLPGIKRTTLDYWFCSATPTLIVAVDITSRRGYFVWHQDISRERLKKIFEGTAQKVSLRIPSNNNLDQFGWDRIRKDLESHHHGLLWHVRKSLDASLVEPIIHELAQAAKQLANNERQRFIIPIENRSRQQEGILGLIDIVQHKSVLHAADMLLQALEPSSLPYMQIESWRRHYHEVAKSVFPTLDNLEYGDVIPGDFQVKFDRNRIHSTRPTLILAIVGFMVRLTPGPHNLPSEPEHNDFIPYWFKDITGVPRDRDNTQGL